LLLGAFGIYFVAVNKTTLTPRNHIMEDNQASPSSKSHPVGSSEKGVSDAHIENGINTKPLARQTGGIVPPSTLEFTQAEEDKVHRKIDYHLLPFVFVLYSLAVLDRSNLGK
jgi:hypothetical protein